MFHFGQNLFKNLARVGLKDKYLNDEKLRSWFKSLFTLCLMPLDKVDQLFDEIKQEMFEVLSKDSSIGRKGLEFVQYFEDYYMNGPFKKEIWNHFNTKCKRTNNPVEGNNNKMKCFCDIKEPCMSKAADLLRQYDATSCNKYDFAKSELAGRIPQNRNNVEREANLRLTQRMYRKNHITLKAYQSHVLDFYSFIPKKKYVEPLVDTSESDDEEVDTDETPSSDDEAIHAPRALVRTQTEMPQNTVIERQESTVFTFSAEASELNMITCLKCKRKFKQTGFKRHTFYCKKNN